MAARYGPALVDGPSVVALAAQSGATLRELMALAGHSSHRAAMTYRQHVAARAVSFRLLPATG